VYRTHLRSFQEDSIDRYWWGGRVCLDLLVKSENF
jgi:hypothetical protein